MNSNIILDFFNLNARQTEVYLILLHLGSGTIQEISKLAKVKRTTAYSVLDILIEKGLVTLSEKDSKRIYVAEDPKKIIPLMEVEEERIRLHKKKALELMPELYSLYNVRSGRPKIRFYEGMEGLKRVFEETLMLKKGEEILAYSSAESIHEYFSDDYVRSYLAKRVKRGIVQRAIAEDSPAARTHQHNDDKELRETRLVNREEFPFSNEINIFGNNLLIISYRDLLGVLIESKDIATTQRAIFELAWKGAADKR